MNTPSISDREWRARDKALCNRGKKWHELTDQERVDELDGAAREGYSDTAFDGSSDQTNASAYVGTAMRGRLDDLRLLQRAADRAEDFSYEDMADLEALGVGDVPPPGEEACDVAMEAEEALYALPLAIESTTTFEIVLGTGGPDDRLLFECDRIDGEAGEPDIEDRWEIRRVLYHYSWEGSGEGELHGEDRETAEAFARRVVPELAE